MTARFLLFASLLTLSLVLQAADGIAWLRLKAIGRGSVNLSVTQNQATIVIFVATDCPMSMDYGQRFGQLAKEYSGKGVSVILVDSNRNEPDAEVEKVRKALNIPIPIYRDTSAVVAGQLTALATPTAVVLDSKGAIRYSGNIDDSRDPAKVKTNFVRAAVDSILGGQPVAVTHTRVLGCSIKR